MRNVYITPDGILKDYGKLSQENKDRVGTYMKNILRTQKAEKEVEKELHNKGELTIDESRYNEIKCSFCGIRADMTLNMVTSGTVNICEECINKCYKIINEHKL